MRIYSSSTFLTRLLFFCFFTFSVYAFSQEQEKDSLDQYSFEELSSKFNATMPRDARLARIYAEKLLADAESRNSTIGIITSYNKFASLENQLGNTEKAIEFIDKAIFLAKQDPEYMDSEVYSSYTKGKILYYTGQYKKAFEYYTITYNFYKELENDYAANALSLSIALIKNNLGDHQTAIELLLKCQENYESTPEYERRKLFPGDYKPSVLLGLSNAYMKYAIKQPSKKDSLLNIAADYNTLGLKEAILKKNKVYEIRFIIGDGIIAEERGNYKKALYELDKASKLVNNYKEPSALTALYYYKGRSYKKLNQFDNAITYLKKADSVSTKNSANYAMLQGAYAYLIEIYKSQNDSDNALKYKGLFYENAQLNKLITQQVREDIHLQYDIDRFEQTIDSLNDTNLKAIIIIGLLVISLGIFFLFYIRQKRKNRLTFQKLLYQLEERKQEPKQLHKKTSKEIVIDDEKVIQVLKALEKFEEKEWFRDKNCDLAFVAKKAKTNKTYLSKIIHTHKQLKFIDYIRNLRIDYALERLKDDPVFRSYDIKSIAEESGFKSSDMFSRAFVKNTGIYPSYYIKNINKINR